MDHGAQRPMSKRISFWIRDGDLSTLEGVVAHTGLHKSQIINQALVELFERIKESRDEKNRVSARPQAPPGE